MPDLTELRITDLKQGVKNPDRVNIYVNDEFFCSLSTSQVVDFKIKKGLIISVEVKEEIKDASEFGKLYQRTLEWVLMRPRSERDTRDYLRKKIFEKKLDKSYIDRVIEKLKSKNYLDDQKFAKYYVENRSVKKGASMKKLSIEMMNKGIPKNFIDEALAATDRNDKTEIAKIIKQKRARYDDEKIIGYLCRQGFSYDLVRETMSEFAENE